MPHSIFFDLDGTLTDPKDGIVASFQHALRAVAVPLPAQEELVALIGPPLHESVRELLGAERSELLPLAIAAYRERYARVGMYENRLHPGVKEGLERLFRTGASLYVVTTKPTVFAVSIVHYFGLTPCFAGVYGAELSGERSDKSELVAHVLANHAIVASDAVMVGDRRHDVAGARANGVRAYGVLWGYGTRAELELAGAERIYEHVPELFTDLAG